MIINNHYIDFVAFGKIINFRQVFAVINKITRFLAILAHEVLFHSFQAFLDAFTDCDGRHDNNKLIPSILLIQLKHSLDIDIGFACTCFHFDIKTALALTIYKLLRRSYIIIALNKLNIFQKLHLIQFYWRIGITKYYILLSFLFIKLLLKQVITIAILCFFCFHRHKSSRIKKVAGILRRTHLSLEHVNHCIDSIRLVLLNFKTELHYSTLLTVCGL